MKEERRRGVLEVCVCVWCVKQNIKLPAASRLGAPSQITRFYTRTENAMSLSFQTIQFKLISKSGYMTQIGQCSCGRQTSSAIRSYCRRFESYRRAQNFIEQIQRISSGHVTCHGAINSNAKIIYISYSDTRTVTYTVSQK